MFSRKTSLAFLALLSACAQKPTPYGPATNGGFGYVDREIAPKHYEIQVRGNEATTVEMLQSYFHTRAKYICLPETYVYDINFDHQTQIQDGQFTGYVFIPTTTTHYPFVSGTITCGEAQQQ